jgi:hypothetical protein
VLKRHLPRHYLCAVTSVETPVSTVCRKQRTSVLNLVLTCIDFIISISSVICFSSRDKLKSCLLPFYCGFLPLASVYTLQLTPAPWRNLHWSSFSDISIDGGYFEHIPDISGSIWFCSSFTYTWNLDGHVSIFMLSLRNRSMIL